LEIYSTITKGVPLATLVKSLSDLLPPDIYLSSLGYTGTQINISALSPNEISIQQYMVNISAVDTVKNVTIREIETEKDNPGLIKFTLSMDIVNK